MSPLEQAWRVAVPLAEAVAELVQVLEGQDQAIVNIGSHPALA
jgi:hypothetical protein